MTIEIILNIVISTLLAITVILGVKLGKRISAFNTSKEELGKFLVEFNNSILRAEKNINELKATGTQVDENLKAQIKKARFLANDLSFLAEKGESVASSLEEKISMSRDIYRKNMADSTAKATRIANPSLNTESATASRPKISEASSVKEPAVPGKKNALDELLRQIAKKRDEIVS